MANTMTLVGNSFTLDFLTAASGYHLIAWKQVAPAYKEGGIFVDSQISPGRRAVYRQEAPIVENIRFGIYATVQTTIAQSLERLRLLSDESFDYWMPGSFIASPVYLKVSVRDEPDFRYAMIYKMEITSELPDLYNSEFQSGMVAGGTSYSFAMQDITLTIERSAWLSHIPGSGESITLTTFEDGKIHAHHVPGTSAACVQIGSTAIDGDMPALGKLTVVDVLASSPSPSRLICGMRSTSRGTNFTAYLNFKQTTPAQYDAWGGSGVSGNTVADATSPTGEAIEYVFAVASGGMVQAAQIEINTVSEFKGRYRAFVRLTRTANVTLDAKLTLKVNGINGTVVYETPIKTVTDVANATIIIDLGEISIPPSDAYIVAGSVEESVLSILVDVPSAVTLRFHHIVILPVDEYVFDASLYDTMNFTNRSLIVDSVSTPRLLTQGVLIDLTPTLTVFSQSNVVASHPQLIIPTGKQVKMWFFGYGSSQEQIATDINATVTLSAAFRYSVLRRLA